MKRTIKLKRNIALFIFASILSLNIEEILDLQTLNYFYLKSFFITLLVTLILFEISELITTFNLSFKIKDIIALLTCLTFIILILHILFEPIENESFFKLVILISILTIYSLVFCKYSYR